MKTPREILLERHRDAEPQLDAIRSATLNTLDRRDELHESQTFLRGSLFRRCTAALWRELVLPSRGIWVGLAAAWVVIFIAHFAVREDEPVVAKKSAPPSREVMIALREQNELRAQLLRDDSKSIDADRPKPAALPHSELRGSMLLA